MCDQRAVTGKGERIMGNGLAQGLSDEPDTRWAHFLRLLRELWCLRG